MKFADFLDARQATGGFSTEDTLACLLPLMRQVARAHATDRVAPLNGIAKLSVENARVYFMEEDLLPIVERRRHVQQLQQASRAPVEILPAVAEVLPTEAVAQFVAGRSDPPVSQLPFDHPVFLTDYVCWEQMLGHHDPLTDIFNLGQILAAVALGLDFQDLQDVQAFATRRHNLFLINPQVHPVMARAIVRMTELQREKRVQELPLLIQALENYRQQEVVISVDADAIEGFESRTLQGKQQVLLDRLQKRLFEISKRNRLLHLRSTLQSIDLTQASVPISHDYHSIRDDQVFVCDAKLQQQIAQSQAISLNRRLNFAEAIYLPSQLNRLSREARRDLAEYGFQPLRLVLCMLHWTNLKETPAERYQSPLVLVPVRLKKKRGVRDVWKLEPISTDAEINPVVRYLFRQLYDIALPERIDLESTTVDSLFEFMRQAVTVSEPAVEFRKMDRPQVRQLHAGAKRRLDSYRRRAQATGRGSRRFQQLDYSYDPANYLPLGIQVFSEYLQADAAAADEQVEPIAPGAQTLSSPLDQAAQFAPDDQLAPEATEGNTSSLPAAKAPNAARQAAAAMDPANPYDWAFDLCCVTLANLRYRKMSLVRDYESLVRDVPHNPAFEAAFSLVPRVADRPPPTTPSLSDRYDVVPCDPTQASAIAQARQKQSYIVQGPPGTGKSQTITNLISDFAARGKRVLFVCEKRAAIDVVFARLKQSGLSDLCCLIHDSQADKKSFVMNLKETYEGFLATALQEESLQQQRMTHIAGVSAALQPLQQFSDSMLESTREAGVPNHQLIERCLELQKDLPPLTFPDEQTSLEAPWPSWRSWNEGREVIDSLVTALQQQVPSGILARHPLRNLPPRLADDRAAEQIVTDGIRESLPLARNFNELAEQLPHSLQTENLGQWRQLTEVCQMLQPLAQHDALSLLDSNSPAWRDWERLRDALRQQQQWLAQTRDENEGWLQRISRRDLPACIEAANQLTRKWFRFVLPQWWRLRKVMNRSYDFQRHPIKPSWVAVLTSLQQEYLAEDAVAEAKRRLAVQFGFPAEEAASLIDLVDSWHRDVDSGAPGIRQVQTLLGDTENPGRIINRLAEQVQPLRYLRGSLDEFLDAYERLTPAGLWQELQQIQAALKQLPEYLGVLPLLQQVPEEVRQVLRHRDLPPIQIEAASAWESWRRIQRRDLTLTRFTRQDRSRQIQRLESAYDEWMGINSETVKQRVQRRFLNHARSGSQQAAGPRQAVEAEKAYANGRKILEHEFGKQMRYRSIRDLVSGDSGRVVRDLKPIWLMSPLSVSDTLPLTGQEFDVVIFDEASQIPLESSIPTLFRAAQAIVVGDEQQLPPTDFFSSRADDEQQSISFRHDGETVIYDLESNSLLNHAARNLHSTMLGWHYRSRDEALISFSNRAFYQGRLLTVPEESIWSRPQPELVAHQASDARTNQQALQDRPISFHFQAQGIYRKRRNRQEADYIAALIRELLLRRDGRTLGVIAFSQAQQNEIEDAIDRLANEDSEFSSLVEAEMVREDDGQFNGLLVKNLENIQGDERDVVILSICYGADDQGRMIMNFGPINKSGGEKRLNVAFSAKHHMAIISSIKYSQITNEYNVGANCLRNYLRYAESVSTGDADTAEMVLHGLAPWQDFQVNQKPVSPVLRQIADRLSEHELLADFHIGHSDFRCDLGLRYLGDTEYRLGVLVDCDGFYDTELELIDRELFRPRLLRVFGWKIYAVLMKDWLQDSQAILDEIVELCGRNITTNAGISADTSSPAAQSESVNSRESQGSPEPPPEDTRRESELDEDR